MQISDQQVIKISRLTYQNFRKQQQEQRLDPKKLKQFKQQYIKPLYPHRLDDNNTLRKYFCCQACCEQTPGQYCCLKSIQPHHSFVKFGMAICLYFNFLKNSSAFYFSICLISVISCAICMIVASSNNIDPISNYQNFLYSTTYGSFSSQNNKCIYGQINSLNTLTFNFKCPYGKTVLLGSVFTEQSVNSLYNCRRQNKKLNMNYSTTKSYLVSQNKNCNTNQTQCSVSLVFNGLQPTKVISYTYLCKDNIYQISNISTSSYSLLYLVVAIDLTFCLCYFIFLLCQSFSDNRQQQFFKKNQLTISNFAIQIQGIKRDTAEKQFKQIINQLNNQLSTNVTNQIFSYTMPECQEMMVLCQERNKVYSKIFRLFKKYYFDNYDELPEFQVCHEEMLKSKTAQEIQELRKQFKESIQKFLSFKRREINKNSKENIPLYLIFNQIKQRNQVLNLQDQSCCAKKLQIEGKQYVLVQPDLPDMIEYENRNRWTKLRVFISWIITLLICACSYIFFGWVQNQQNQITSTYNYNIDCSIIFTPSQLNLIDVNLTNNKDYQTCICRSVSLSNLQTNNKQFCIEWQKQYIIYVAVPIFISCGIVIYNIIVSKIFKIITKFQKHKYLVNQQLSFAIKRTFMLIMNTALIMILLNTSFSKSKLSFSQFNFLFTQKYDDVSADWYQDIGVIITLTLIFNIAFPVIELMVNTVVKTAVKCWDRRCYCKPTSRETKKEYIALYESDIYPISQRYAFLMSTFVITLSFSGVMPVLNIVSAFSFIILYFSDKLLLFKFYQTPINYTHTLHLALFKVITFGLIAHFVLTSYCLSQPTLKLGNLDLVSSVYSLNSGNQRINAMITTPQIIPYVVLLVLIVTFLILKAVVFDRFTECYKLLKDKLFQVGQKFQEVKLVKLLNRHQLQTLLDMGQYSLQNFKMRKRESIKPGDLTQSERQLKQNKTLYETIIKNNIKMLNERLEQMSQYFSEQKVSLLGIPSYEYLIKCEQLSKMQGMVIYQRLLKEAIKGKKLTQYFNEQMLKPRDQSSQHLDKIQNKMAIE